MRDDDERLRQAIRVGNIGIFEHDHETGTIFWSAELKEFYGWDAEELATLPKILSHVHPDDADWVIAAVRRAHDPEGDGAFDVEHRIIDRRGNVGWVQTRSRTHFVTIGDQRRASRTIGAVQDVTERRIADERLRVLDTVLSSSTQALAVADATGTLTFANAALSRLWGYSDREVLRGRSLFDLWKTSDLPAAALDRIRDERIRTVEQPAHRADGRPFHVAITIEAVCDGRGALTQVLVTFRDVTESKRVQDALRIKDQAIASSFIGIAMADASENIIYANEEFLRLAGCSYEDAVLGRSLWDICEAEDARTIAAQLGAQGAFQGEVSGRRPNGQPLHLNVSARVLLGPEGERVNIVASFADVTDRKRLEAQLRHAQKMESVGRLAGGVAHDFNNLLTVISGGLELGLAALPLDHSSRACLADVAEAAQSAAALTRQLLAFSRKEVIAPKALDLNQIIRRVEKMILRLLGEDMRLETLCGDGLAPVFFDAGQVEQIILNLAVNARDAMSDGGRLTIETSNIVLDGACAGEHLDVHPGPYVLLTVSDNGAGLTAEARAHLFEPFFTTKAPGKGTGLGLAMVYGAVQQNGGHIDVFSEPGHGTAFKIYLPAAKRVSPAAAPRAQPGLGARPARILLVEDDGPVRALAAKILERAGYSVHAYATGEDALVALPSLRPAPELLITDVVMPGMNGRILAERVCAVLPGVRVLFVSGYTQNVIVSHGVLKDGIEFLAKPYSVDQLTRRVRELLLIDEAAAEDQAALPGPGQGAGEDPPNRH
jgi:two-component system cell cycle sensor histidine kinase/response regulator CckA